MSLEDGEHGVRSGYLETTVLVLDLAAVLPEEILSLLEIGYGRAVARSFPERLDEEKRVIECPLRRVRLEQKVRPPESSNPE